MMDNVNQHERSPDDEIDLRALFGVLWAGKWIIVLITFVFAAGGVAYALYKPNIYQATVLLAPTDGGGGSGVGGQLSGLASLAGVNLGQDASSKTVIAKEVLQSRAFLADFIKRHSLAVPLFGTSGWDGSRSSWIYDREVYNPDTEEWKQDDNGKSMQPTEWDLVKKFRASHLGISEKKESGLVMLSVKSQSPVAAKNWAKWLVNDINEHMRQQDIEEAEASIEYLEGKLKDTNIAGMQQVFYQLIESETRTVMLANAQAEYVFKTVDPAVVPQEKSEPRRALICVVATMLGGLLGVVIVFIMGFFRDGTENHQTSESQSPTKRDAQ